MYLDGITSISSITNSMIGNELLILKLLIANSIIIPKRF